MKIIINNIDSFKLVPESIQDKLFLYHFLKPMKGENIERYIEIINTFNISNRGYGGGGDCFIEHLSLTWDFLDSKKTKEIDIHFSEIESVEITNYDNGSHD